GHRVGLVADVGQLALALVLVGVRLGVAAHALDLLHVQAAAALDLDVRILARLHVLGDTFRMPLASMSKVTSIFGTPRGADSMPVRSNCPSRRLSAAIGRSPWNTFTVTARWL